MTAPPNTSDTPTACGCTWDPEFHRYVNIRRGRADYGSACSNPVTPGAFGAEAGLCVPCLFGCAP